MKNKKIISGVTLAIILIGMLIYCYADDIYLALHPPKEEHVFKTKPDAMIPQLAQQLGLANTNQMDGLANQAVKVYNHQSQSKNGYFESYIEIPVSQQSRFVSMVFYQKIVKTITKFQLGNYLIRLIIFKQNFFLSGQKQNGAKGFCFQEC